MPSPSSDRPIAFVLPDMRYGGAERVALRLIRSLVERGYPVELVLMEKHGELLEHLPPEVRLIDLGANRIRSAMMPLIRYLKERRPRTIQVRMWPLTVIAIVAAKLARVTTRVVISDHVDLSQQYGGSWRTLAAVRSTIRLIYPLAYARICVSEGVAADLSRLSGLRRSAFDVIYNPIEPPSKIETTAEVERAWAGGRGKRILAVGSLKEQKNHRLLIDAFARLSDPTARLMIVGEGPLRRVLEQQAATMGVSDRVVMPGLGNPWPYYASANLFVLSSDYEGLGNVIIEAMYARLPVVSTNCPSGPAEILADGKFGRLVPVGDAGRLCAAIKAALSETSDRGVLTARAAELSGAAALNAYERLLRHP